MSSNRSAFKQNLRGLVAKGGIAKAKSDAVQDIIDKWREIQDCKQDIDECGWDEITASLFNMKTAMKEAGVPQTDIDYVQNALRDVKAIRVKLQDLYVREGSRVDQLEALWGLEAGALE